MRKFMEQKNESSIPLVTVITATYNLIKSKREKFIIQCLESVHNQHYSNIEHIVIDGASDDGTLPLLKKYESLGWIKLSDVELSYNFGKQTRLCDYDKNPNLGLYIFL